MPADVRKKVVSRSSPGHGPGHGAHPPDAAREAGTTRPRARSPSTPTSTSTPAAADHLGRPAIPGARPDRPAGDPAVSWIFKEMHGRTARPTITGDGRVDKLGRGAVQGRPAHQRREPPVREPAPRRAPARLAEDLGHAQPDRRQRRRRDDRRRAGQARPLPPGDRPAAGTNLRLRFERIARRGRRRRADAHRDADGGRPRPVRLQRRRR